MFKTARRQHLETRPQDYDLLKTPKGPNTFKHQMLKKLNGLPRIGWALHQACLEGDFNFAVESLEAGANPNAVDDDGFTALRVVCEQVGGSWALVQALLVPHAHVHSFAHICT
jgi:hypothetical protein